MLLVLIPFYWEWDAVAKKDPAAKREYLESKLRAAAKGNWEGI